MARLSPATPTPRLSALPILLHPRTGWLCCAFLVFAIYKIVVRASGYDHWALLLDAGYMFAYVWLPGAVILWARGRGPVSFVETIALGLPIGYAVEIATFIGASALGVREFYAWTPVIWLALAGWQWREKREYPVKMAGRNPWLVAGVLGVLLASVLTAVSQLYLQAPLANGVPETMTHHDWVYLISRAAEIKNHWPLEDPSMAGARLSYHYFLLVHVAASSLVTGSEISWLLLRTTVLPLGTVLIFQGFLLGRILTRRAWGGVLTAALMLMTEEVSFVTSSQWGTFFNLFIRWLYLSPTFFFGMIFFGALTLWIYRMSVEPTARRLELLVLVLLAAVGTGAKGTVVPPLIVALGALCILRFLQTKQIAWQQFAMLGALSFGFVVVYAGAMSEWGSGGAKIAPLVSMKLTTFWQDHAESWTHGIQTMGLPPGMSLFVAQLGCALVIIVGSHGVRLLALPYLVGWKRRQEPLLVLWLAGIWFTCQLTGQLMELDSNSQLYLLFAGRLMLAALAAGGLIEFLPKLMAWVRRDAVAVRAMALETASFLAKNLSIVAMGIILAAMVWAVLAGRLAWWAGVGGYVIALIVFTPGRSILIERKPSLGFARSRAKALLNFTWKASPLAVVVLLLAIQTNHWRLRNEEGFRRWVANRETINDGDMQLLLDGLRWLRQHTDPAAVIVANAFTLQNINGASAAVIDRTTVDKYYYYSALAERRLWVEGPTYLRDQAEASRRMQLAGRIFYEGLPAVELPIASDQIYLLVDRFVSDREAVRLPAQTPVFSNRRLSIYRVVTGHPGLVTAGTKKPADETSAGF